MNFCFCSPSIKKKKQNLFIIINNKKIYFLGQDPCHCSFITCRERLSLFTTKEVTLKQLRGAGYLLAEWLWLLSDGTKNYTFFPEGDSLRASVCCLFCVCVCLTLQPMNERTVTCFGKDTPKI